MKALFRRGVARKDLRKWGQARIGKISAVVSKVSGWKPIDYSDIQTFIDNGGDVTLGSQELKAITDLESLPPSRPPSYASSDLSSGLENLHLEDDSSSFTIHTSTAVQKGKGAFASRDIQKGYLILSERPIFHISLACPPRLSMAAVRNLSPVHLDHFLSLENSHTDCSCYHDSIVGIVRTNGFSITDGDAGICLKASRFNHSCSPNARWSFERGQLRIYALGSIPRGEEIFIAYISCRDVYGSPRRSRQATLRARYHFTCACSVCSLPKAQSKMSDDRRVKANELWDVIWNFTPWQEVQRLNVIVEAIHLLKEEGLVDPDDFD